MSQSVELVPRIVKGPPCTVGLLHSLLPPDEAAVLEEWFNTATMTGEEIAFRVKVEGYADIAGKTVARHRGGRCRNCPRPRA